MTPNVSVVVPTYERPMLCQRALQSLFRQTAQDWECILVVNGLQHRPAYQEWLQGEWSLEPRLTVIFHPEAGLPRALNLGSRCARGDYLAVLEDDDEWHPNFLLHMAQALAARPACDLVYCDQVEEHEGGQVNWVNPPAGNFARERLLRGNWIAFPMAVFRRRECLQTLGQFDEQAGGATDWDTWLRLSAKHQFYHLVEPLVIHHWHGGNLCLDKAHMARANLQIARKRARGEY